VSSLGIIRLFLVYLWLYFGIPSKALNDAAGLLGLSPGFVTRTFSPRMVYKGPLCMLSRRALKRAIWIFSVSVRGFGGESL